MLINITRVYIYKMSLLTHVTGLVFEDAHKGGICVRVFIGVSACVVSV